MGKDAQTEGHFKEQNSGEGNLPGGPGVSQIAENQA
jgi:hypothetical protein